MSRSLLKKLGVYLLESPSAGSVMVVVPPFMLMIILAFRSFSRLLKGLTRTATLTFSSSAILTMTKGPFELHCWLLYSAGQFGFVVVQVGMVIGLTIDVEVESHSLLQQTLGYILYLESKLHLMMNTFLPSHT